MKKWMVPALVAFTLAAMPRGVFAQDEEGGQERPRPSQGGAKMGVMITPTMIATPDGGVVIMIGPKLFKYDSDLNLVKATELPRPGKPEGQRQEPGSGPGSEPPPEQ